MSDEMREKVDQTLATYIGGTGRRHHATEEILALIAAELERVERERDEARELTSCAVTVGNGLSVYGTVEAIGRVQDYILLDSRHPVEAADVRRSLARALQAAEARATAAEQERDAAQARLAEAVEAMGKAIRVLSDAEVNEFARLLDARDILVLGRRPHIHGAAGMTTHKTLRDEFAMAALLQEHAKEYADASNKSGQYNEALWVVSMALSRIATAILARKRETEE